MHERAKRVVILGGGFAGLVAAHVLLKSAVSDQVEITIIDRSAEHVYTPWLYETSSVSFSPRTKNAERKEMLAASAFPFAHLPTYERIRFRKGEVSGVHTEQTSVVLADGLSVKYDILVVALGAEVNYFGIPGLPKFCIPLKTLKDARDIDATLRNLVKVPSKRARTVNVIGGGPAGVEVAAEIVSALRRLEGDGQIPEGTIKIQLMDREKILGMFDPRVRKAALKRFRKIGVEVLEGTSVLEAKKDHLMVKSESLGDHRLPSDLCIWSGGVKPSEAVRVTPFQKEPRGRIIIDRTFQTPGYPSVFAAGDCAAMLIGKEVKPDPQSAEVAVAQAKVLAGNIVRFINGEKLQAFPVYKRWDVLVALGAKYAAGNVWGFFVRGRVAYTLKLFSDLRYFLLILPPRLAFRKWRKAVILYEKNDL